MSDPESETRPDPKVDSRVAPQAESDAAPATEAQLLARLDALGIGYSHHTHPPLRTVAESRELRGALPGVHVKNMFLKDKKGTELVLVTCRENRQIRIGDLEKVLGTRRLSFASPERLMQHLGVIPGAVTPLAAMNDTAGAVRVVLDAQVMAAELLCCHPLHNEASVALSPADLLRFLEDTGHAAETVDFDALEAAALGTRAEGL
ncbi:prolyl-tRNA synthetase associated domain-containing protein [Paroceanicella profunda]|uniref:Prolyl-tRNA synthetase associated domain-containing protein n=1 Tax=Paroceanicella profunda TaxID=2579971 RepID=A0A5B8FVP8_9RHOB|nr:prolyl-tRNA synthetase associated domain-containing protein [Paroceanicella profunda]QDL91230.1 prolyl-tRNA synthetase associated domain-containing protein [Paroceanicella profunda]